MVCFFLSYCAFICVCCTWRAATFFIMPQTPRRCLLLLKILNSNWPVSKAIIYSRIYITIYRIAYETYIPTTRAGSISCILGRLDPSSPPLHTKALPRAHSASTTTTPNINHSLLIFIYRHECRKILVPHASCMACLETSKIGVRACVYAWLGG